MHTDVKSGQLWYAYAGPVHPSLSVTVLIINVDVECVTFWEYAKGEGKSSVCDLDVFQMWASNAELISAPIYDERE